MSMSTTNHHQTKFESLLRKMYTGSLTAAEKARLERYWEAKKHGTF